MRRRVARLLRQQDGFGLVEAMIAVTILVIGLLAVSGLLLATATQAQVADLRSDQVIAAQTTIEAARAMDFDAVATSVDTVLRDNREFVVTTTVTELSNRTKQLSVEVDPTTTGLTTRTYTSVLHRPRTLPAAP